MSREQLNQKRKLILHAAGEVFAKYGFYQAKMEDIAVLAGIGKGTVYEYYRSKEHLFRETIKTGMEYYSLQLAAEVDREESAYDKMKTFVRLCLTQAGNIHAFVKITMDENCLIKDQEFRQWLQKMHKKQFTVLEGILREGINKKEIRPVNVVLFARLFAGSIGFLLNPFVSLDMGYKDNEEIAEEVISYYFQGLAMNENV